MYISVNKTPEDNTTSYYFIPFFMSYLALFVREKHDRTIFPFVFIRSYQYLQCNKANHNKNMVAA